MELIFVDIGDCVIYATAVSAVAILPVMVVENFEAMSRCEVEESTWTLCGRCAADFQVPKMLLLRYHIGAWHYRSLDAMVCTV